MKLYKVRDGEIHSVKVRETEKMYIAEEKSGPAFGWLGRFYKHDHWPTSEIEAVQEAINKNLIQTGMFQDKLKRLEKEMEELRALHAEVFGFEPILVD